ncbi:MAG TPA: AAA family ATPase [Polyangiaceae bacterium]|nr:AAA family ATPase [Polyangiaceae bacterium]
MTGSTLQTDLVRGRTLIETHTAWVFLDEQLVWKVKKPVDYGFLDYSTLAKRKAACEAEVALNARLAPSVYLGVDPVTRDASGHHLAGAGDVVDYAVRMRRLSDETRADLRLANGALSHDDIRAIAEYLVQFHARMPTSDEIARFGAPEAILANVRENFSQTRDSIGAHLGPAKARELERTQVGFVERNAELFRSRAARGRVRDGHGDLRLEHVYLTDDGPPQIIDCIEFNERFRYADVCADIAFLSMDLERLGRADLAEYLLASYASASGDHELYRVVDFYEGYRAYVRGKVASILAADAGAAEATRQTAERAARLAYLLSLSEGRKRLLEPCVVAVGGIIASGKSTVAAAVGRMASAPVVEADRVRKELAGVPATTPLGGGAWSGAYASEETARVYAELVRRAGFVLESGRPVVLDASFRSPELRALAVELARRHAAPFYFVECRADLDECRRRLRLRSRGPSVSDGRLEIFDAFVAAYRPADELPAGARLLLDTALPLEANELRLDEFLPTWPRGFTR